MTGVSTDFGGREGAVGNGRDADTESDPDTDTQEQCEGEWRIVRFDTDWGKRGGMCIRMHQHDGLRWFGAGPMKGLVD